MEQFRVWLSMKLHSCFCVLCMLGFLLTGCKPMPNDGIPFYLNIDTAGMKDGSSHGITDVWLETGATNLGAYELPANFPVLEKDEVLFLVNAGIEESGQSGIRINYPFYQPDTFSIFAKLDTTYSYRPYFRYRAATQFRFATETFESTNGFNGITPVSDGDVKYGLWCGKISVNSVDSNKIAAQISSYALPAGQEIWLEFDYRAEVPFFAGYYANGSTVIRNPILFINPKSDWNHIYIKLSTAIGTNPAPTYNLYFEALRPTTSTGGSVWIDNVKLLYFNP